MLTHHFCHMSSTGKEDNPLVSVIVPVYNASSTVVKAVKSVVDQTYYNWELIIIDDGSTDSSAIVIADFLHSLNNDVSAKIVFLRKQNEGPSRSRNLGIDKSTGTLIAFLDSDDIWVSDKLKIQVSFLNNNIGIISGGFNKSILHSDIGSHYITFSKLLKKNYFMTPTVLIAKAKIGTLRFNENQKYSEDYKFWLDVTYRYEGLYITEVLAKSATAKYDFGISGLSANLWAMEKGELMNYYSLFAEKKIKFAEWILYSSLSLLKYIRRFLIIKFGLHGK